MTESLAVNGINGADGSYLVSGLSAAQVSRIAQGERLEEAQVRELLHSRRERDTTFLAFREGVDPKNLAESGWGVVFAHSDGARVARCKEALEPLLSLRREQAGALYREFTGPDAMMPNESKSHFLARHGVMPGSPEPSRVPYYLLIVADPEAIPFRAQYQLDVEYAVGRLHFASIADYSAYAASVVSVESGAVRRDRVATFFGVRNPDDRATQLSADNLVTPLARMISEDQPDWKVRTRIGGDCDKAALRGLLSGGTSPAFLLTASHGLGFPFADRRQSRYQGALLCQDWPGPVSWKGRPIPPEHFFSADDVREDLAVAGMISFHFACYAGGTPRHDDFSHAALGQPGEITQRAFVSRLFQDLASLRSGGVLACVGHVERAWSYSFLWGRAGPQLEAFRNTIKRLVEGHPIGSAMEYFNQRYAALATDLSAALEDVRFGKRPDDLELAGLWAANNDARNYVVFGDPAVRLPV